MAHVPRQRIQIVLKDQTHDRLQRMIPAGLRSGLINEAVEMILNFIQRYGTEGLTLVRQGRTVIGLKPDADK